MGVVHRRGLATSATRSVVGTRLAALLLLVSSVYGVFAVAYPQAAWAVSGNAQQLLNLINQERATVGAQPLTFRDDLVAIAADHSAWMASTGNFEHRSDLSAGVTGPWTRIGENIAYGWSVSSIHQMFMASEGHCINNMYAGFNRVGIEFATGGNGAMYVTVVFVQESGGSLPAPTVCPYDYSTTTTTSPPSTTTTTAPPTTTTTAAPPTTTSTTAPAPTTTSTTAPAPTTTTTLRATTTTSTTSTTVQAPTTTTTASLAATTTTADVTSTTLRDSQLSGSVPSATTSTTTEGVAAVAEPFEPAPDEGPSADSTEPAAQTVVPSESDGADPFPLLPVAGGATLVTLAGVWWLIGLKKTAAATVAHSGWNIPHGGTRPSQ